MEYTMENAGMMIVNNLFARLNEIKTKINMATNEKEKAELERQYNETNAYLQRFSMIEG